MTIWDLFVAARRRWYVVVVGLLVTVGTVYAVHEAPGVYSTQTDVLFLAPQTRATPNTISSPTSGVISMAGLVERIVNKGVEKSPTSGSVALTGQGIDDGYSVELPNAGGQWADNFNRPVLQIQVTGPDPDAVRTTLNRIVGQIAATARDLQAARGVGPAMLIATRTSPAEPVVSYQQGHRAMGAAVVLLMGALLTALAVAGADASWRMSDLRAVRRGASPIWGKSSPESTA